jgi:hypothetical protein
MAHNFTCPRCRMNHRQNAPGICKYCSPNVPLCAFHPLTTEDLIRAKDAAGLSLTPIEYAIARVRMRPLD